MATKKTGLGRGLDALLGPSPKINPTTEEKSNFPQEPRFNATNLSQSNASNQENFPHRANLPLDLLKPGVYQPRRDMHPDALEELAESIRANGVLAPISVRKLTNNSGDNDQYEIIAGERRWRAAQIAGLNDIPVIIREVDDQQAAAIALIENLQREDLNPLEEAEGLKRLISDFQITHQEAARAVSKSRAAVTNLLRLLDLSAEVRDLLASGAIQMGHARALLALTSSRAQALAAQDIRARGLSVRQTEALVKNLLAGKTLKPAFPEDPDIRRLQDDLSATLGAKLNIQHTPKGKGKLVINYNSLDELEGILSHIK
ncbi:MAG: ParB/RepB/Spo0J family partition protein [Pseudomonadota bacterium]|nr:ParB/RepB/Spo0J family partition protein [Pseudomonadota bacterium]